MNTNTIRIQKLVLAALCLVWSALWICVMPLGPLMIVRDLLWLLLPLAIAAVWIFIPELLACRAAGGLLVLVPAPMLSAAAWHPSVWRYAVILYAYAMIVAGMYYIALPWLLRDHIDWAHRHPRRAKAVNARRDPRVSLVVHSAKRYSGKLSAQRLSYAHAD